MNKVLLVSLGSIGQRHLKNARELLPQAEIAVYRTHFHGDSVLPNGADRIFLELNDALAFRPDVVIISSPASEHVRHALAFIQNGAHLFIEKPLAMNYSEITGLIEASRASDRFSMVGYVLRFQPVLYFIRKLLGDGMLGNIRTANVQVGQYLPDWRPASDYRQGVSAQKKLGGGALLELSHEIDYSTWLFGMPDQIFCSSGKISDLDIDVEDSACVIFEYGRSELAKRVVVQVDFLQRVASMAIQVVGSEATLHADLISEKVYITAPDQDDRRELDVPRMQQGNEMYLRQFDFLFVNCFDDYKPRFDQGEVQIEHVTIEYAARILQLVDLAKQSATQGLRMKFEG